MIIEKTFHNHESIQATKTRLSNLSSLPRQLKGVRHASVTADGIGHFEFHAGLGFHASVDLAEVESDDPNQALFRSENGNVKVAGLIEYIAIRDDLTEVVLTLDYTIQSPVHRVVDLLTGTMDRFLVRQLRELQTIWSGESGSRAESRSRRSAPQFAPTPRYA